MSEQSAKDKAGLVGQEFKELLVDDIAGRKEWKGSKFGYVTGLSLLGGFLSGAVRTVGGSVGRIGRMYSAMTRGEDNSDLPSVDESVEDPGQRFAMAMEAHGKTEHDLTEIARNSHRGFFLYASILLAVVVLGIGSMRYGNLTGLPGPLDVALRFALVPALAGLMIRFGYLNWMVRNRRLDGMLSYLRSGGFFPVKSIGRSAAAFIVGSLVVAWVALNPAPAYAADSDKCHTGSAGSTVSAAMDLIAKPHCDDIFYNMLRIVVPDVGPVDGVYKTNAHNAVAAGFTAFSGVLMLFASLMLGWHVVAGIVQSAYTGKVLGERWHQIWAPSRVVLGVGSLAPIAGGYGAVQVLVIYLMVWGGNLANTIWVPYVQALGGGISSASTGTGTEKAREAILPRVAGAEEIVREIARRELCNAVGNKFYANGNYGNRGVSENKLINPSPGSMMMKDSDYTAVETISRVGGWLFDGFKGAVNLVGRATDLKLTDSGASKPEVKVTSTRYSIDYGRACGKVMIDMDEVTKQGDPNSLSYKHAVGEETFDKARKEAVEKVVGHLRDAAGGVAATYVPGGNGANALSGTEATADQLREFHDAIKLAGQDYSKTLLEASKSQIQNLDTNNANGKSLVKTMVEQVSTKGWAVSGTYYVTLSQVQSAIYSKAMEKPSFRGLEMDPAEGMKTGLARALIGNEGSPGAVRAFDAWWDSSARATFSELDPMSVKAGRDNADADNWFNKVVEGLGGNSLLTYLLEIFRDLDPFNPMRSMTEFGHQILMLFYSAVAAMAALAVVGKIIGFFAKLPTLGLGGGGGGMTGMFGGVVGTFFSLLMTALFAVGVIHAYVIPMIPYMQVLFFLMGMLILVVEALIAAPLWAFFHVRMDGQELVDQVQKPGYMIAFNLLLRPSLMILGLMMSLFVFGAMSWFISKTYTVAAMSAGSGHSVGFIGTLVMVCIVCYLHYQVALRSFGLINQVPDRVLRWFGQGGEQLGESHDNDKLVGFAVGRLGSKGEEFLRASGLAGKIKSS